MLVLMKKKTHKDNNVCDVLIINGSVQWKRSHVPPNPSRVLNNMLALINFQRKQSFYTNQPH